MVTSKSIKSRTVRIKRLHDVLEVTTAKVRVTTVKHKLVLLVILMKNMLSISAAGTKVTTVSVKIETIIAPSTTEEKAQRKLELKTRSTLLMGIPNEHQLKFNSIKDAMSLLKAIDKRFRGNAATKKTQRNLLKQQYENFTASSSERSLQVNPNSLQHDKEDINKNSSGDLEEIDLRWQIAMLTIRARRFLKNTGRKFSMNGTETIGFDKSKVECYNCHKRGHFARECRAPSNQENINRENTRRVIQVQITTSNALVSCDGSGYDWSDQAEEGLTNFALMAYSSTSSNSEPTVKKPVVETSEAKDSTNKPKVVKKNNGAPIIEDWVSDSEEEDMSQAKIQKKIVEPSFANIEFVKSKEQVKTPKKITVKQGNQNRMSIHSLRGNQRKWNNMMSQRLKSNFEMINKACYVCGSFDHLHGKNVNTARPKAVVNAARPKAILNAVKGNQVNVVKASACWVWKPKTKVLVMAWVPKRFDYIDAQGRSKHMTGNMSYLTDFEEIDGGFVAFGGNPKGWKIIGRANKDETSGILKSFITGVENIIDLRVKVIRCDNGTEFKNKEMHQFCERKGKFDSKADEGFFVGYSINSKAFRVFNSRTRIFEENLHVQFRNQSNGNARTKACDDASKARMETIPGKITY
ncbi:putative ribonuclease H-like domain-containing protein [Tanacetum coccineum]